MNEITGISLPDISLNSLLLNFLLGILLSIAICWHYTARAVNKILRRDLGLVLPIICLTTILVISVVKSSLALSLGLVGALSIVRFRTPIKEPEELAYIFLAIAIGLALGADQREVALISVPIVLLVISATSFFIKRKTNENSNLLLNLQIEDPDEDKSLNKVFSKLGKFADEIKVQRIDQGENQICITGLISFDSEEDLSEFSNHLKSNFKGCRFTLLDDINNSTI